MSEHEDTAWFERLYASAEAGEASVPWFRGGPNPVPVKTALTRMGLLDSDAVRRPLLPMDEPDAAAMTATLRGLGLIEVVGGRLAAEPREAVA